MALSRPHLADVLLVFLVKSAGDYIRTQRQTQTLIRSEGRQIGPKPCQVRAYVESFHHSIRVC